MLMNHDESLMVNIPVMKSAISVRGLSKEYDERFAVNNATFEVPSGIICGFIGPNGAGKTTTIRALLGLIKPTSGDITVLGSSNPHHYLSKIGAMIEGPSFYPLLSGAANLKVLADLGGIPTSRVKELLRLVGLEDRANSKFKTYSLGMKQRLGIAAALLPDPELLILDEPTNGLDPNGILEIRNLIKKLANGGKTIFVSSHLLAELEAICENVVMIKEGKIIYSGTAKELIGNQSGTALFIEPEYSVDLNRLVKLLEDGGFTYKVENHEISIDGGTPAAAHINRMAFENGITLKRIGERKATLEESFFEMVAE
jgi:ABC-2 type transport system ATP-binding protein